MAEDKPRALVLEDSELGRWALTHALEARGFVVQAVSTWAEASTWLHELRFVLALADVSSVPGKVDVLAAEMRKGCPETRLVLLVDEDEVGELRRACGPHPEILAKPVDLRALAHIALDQPGSGHGSREA